MNAGDLKNKLPSVDCVQFSFHFFFLFVLFCLLIQWNLSITKCQGTENMFAIKRFRYIEVLSMYCNIKG